MSLREIQLILFLAKPRSRNQQSAISHQLLAISFFQIKFPLHLNPSRLCVFATNQKSKIKNQHTRALLELAKQSKIPNRQSNCS